MSRRVVFLVVGLFVLQGPVAEADPDVTVRCGGGIRARLVLDRPDRIRLRFILHGSAPGDRWTIWIRRAPGPMGGGHMVFHDTRVASDSGDFVMQRTFLRRRPLPIFGVTARDWQSDQECHARVWGPEDQAVPASAGLDVVRQGTCSDGARSRLELTDIGDRIEVRFEVHRSPVGHSWHIVLRHAHGPIDSPDWQHAWIFEYTRVASESGDLAVQRSVVDRTYDFFFADAFRVKAADQQTGQVCMAVARIGPV
jgi:hypothetical protein